MIPKYYSETKLSDNCFQLESALSSLLDWLRMNYMSINRDKCSVLHLGKRFHPDSTYSIGTDGIHRTSLMKDMGVLMDEKQTFSEHIARIALEGNRILGLVKRTFACITPEIFKIVYNHLVRPKLEYASQIWSPFLKRDILRLENIQRRATKSVQGMKYLSYRDRLKYLGLTCLEIRRKRGDLVFMWKYINGITTIQFNQPNICNPHRISLRGNSLSLLPLTNKPPKTRLRNNFLPKES